VKLTTPTPARVREPALLDRDMEGWLADSCEQTPCDGPAGANARVAPNKDKTPRRQLAVIGHPRAIVRMVSSSEAGGRDRLHLARLLRRRNWQAVDGRRALGHSPVYASLGDRRDIDDQQTLASRSSSSRSINLSRFKSGGVASSTSAGAIASSVGITFCPSLEPADRTEWVSASSCRPRASAGTVSKRMFATL